VTFALTVWAVEVGNASETASYRWGGFHFDRYAGTLLSTELYRDLDRGQKLNLMNYSIHVGKILGLPGQLLALAASLIVVPARDGGPPLVESRPPYPRGAIGGACCWRGVRALRW
jgi:hypothetical protein